MLCVHTSVKHIILYLCMYIRRYNVHILLFIMGSLEFARVCLKLYDKRPRVCSRVPRHKNEIKAGYIALIKAQ